MKKAYLVVLILAVFMVSSAGATSVQWTIANGGNGHWYERVDFLTNAIH